MSADESPAVHFRTVEGGLGCGAAFRGTTVASETVVAVTCSNCVNSGVYARAAADFVAREGA